MWRIKVKIIKGKIILFLPKITNTLTQSTYSNFENQATTKTTKQITQNKGKQEMGSLVPRQPNRD